MNELILVVDDEPGILTELANILKDEGYRTVTTASGGEALEMYVKLRPDVVFLDIWLPDRDGLEALAIMRQLDPQAAVVMMSGHGTARTAVKAVKSGAIEYLEKPFSYQTVMEALGEALAARRATPRVSSSTALLDLERALTEQAVTFGPPAILPITTMTGTPQRTIGASTVIYGLGLHSGGQTGMVIQPLPPDSGIHFMTVPGRALIPAHISAVGDTEYATTLVGGGEEIRTVEHFLAACHAHGITNLLIKVHGEIPVLDGSAVEFSRKLAEIGVIDQDAPRREVVIDRRWEIATDRKRLVIEPCDHLTVSYRLRYPAPIGEQFYEFSMSQQESFDSEIAPARTFGFLRDVKMLNEMGLGSGGRLDNFILVGDDHVINTELRFPDEFVRHKVLDIIGDLYLLGYPVRGRVTAEFTGHRDNVAIQRAILRTFEPA